MVRDPKPGDVFVVPTGDGRAGVGQVVATYGKDMLLSSSWGLEGVQFVLIAKEGNAAVPHEPGLEIPTRVDAFRQCEACRS